VADVDTSSPLTIRKRVAQLLEPGHEIGQTGKIVDLILMLLIVANVIMAMLSTMPAYDSRWGRLFGNFEVFSVCVFTVEYLLRIWSCVDLDKFHGKGAIKARLKWMFSPLGLIDLLAILPFYIFLFLPANIHSALALRLFRAMRLLRIFKLARYSAALDILGSVVRREASPLLMIASLSLVLLILSAWGMYLIEGPIQPEHFSSVPEALWWAVITMTTVGYGDVIPVTNGGRFFAGLVSIIGFATAALPAGVLAAGFVGEVRRREQTYNRVLRMALSDGSITPHQAQELVKVRDALGLSEKEAHELFLDVKHSRPSKLLCPHCGKSWHPGFPDEPIDLTTPL
jgi:voltage-gated potassium channel